MMAVEMRREIKQREAPATALRRGVFDLGCAAFKQSFPVIAKDIPLEGFYVCPLCLRAFGEEALRLLTREHVPPRSVGGHRLVLTCRECNSAGGHETDSHARKEADLFDFAAGRLKEIKAGLRTTSGQVPIRLSAAPGGVLAIIVPKAASTTAQATVESDFGGSVGEGNWEGFTFKVVFAPFSTKRAAASWLRSAYLAFFAALGYRFILRPELDDVRAKIKDPECEHPRTFRIIRREPSEPMLIRIDGPTEFCSYAMLYGRNMVFLPRDGDGEFYIRLTKHPDTEATLSGILQFPWPRRATFALDLVAR